MEEGALFDCGLGLPMCCTYLHQFNIASYLIVAIELIRCTQNLTMLFFNVKIAVVSYFTCICKLSVQLRATVALKWCI